MSNYTDPNFYQQQISPSLENLPHQKFKDDVPVEINEVPSDISLSKQRAAELEISYQKNKQKKQLPLQRKISDPQPFPLAALGEVLGSAAKRVHEVVKAPDSICGQSFLAAASLVTQAYADVHIDGRTYPISIFSLTVGESGDRKSAVDNIALNPIRKYEEMLVKTNKEEKRVYKNKIDIWKKKRQEILTHSTNIIENELNDFEKEPLPPLEPHLILEEPTYEGLIKLLATGQPSIGLFTDEGGRMIGGYAMNNDNLLKTACGLSSLWDGKPVTRIRGAKDENFIIYGRRFSMHLMVQENIFTKIQQNELLFGQGLIARCLVTHAQSNVGNRPYAEVDLSEDSAIKTYMKRFAELLDQPFPLTNPDIPNELSPKKLALNKEAKTAWIQFHDELDCSMRREGAFFIIKRIASKAAEQVLRIAGVLAIFEDSHSDTITTDVLERAIILVRYYLDEAIRIMELGLVDKELEIAQKTLEWMKRKSEPGKIFQLQEIYQNGPNEVRRKKTALKMMNILQEHGLIVQLEKNMFQLCESWEAC